MICDGCDKPLATCFNGLGEKNGIQNVLFVVNALRKLLQVSVSKMVDVRLAKVSPLQTHMQVGHYLVLSLTLWRKFSTKIASYAPVVKVVFKVIWDNGWPSLL